MAKYIIKYKKFSSSTAASDIRYIQFDYPSSGTQASKDTVLSQIFEYQLFDGQYDDDATTGKDYYLAGWSKTANQHSLGDALNITDDGAGFFTGLNGFGSTLEFAGTVSATTDLPISEGNTTSHLYFVSGENNFYKWDGEEWGPLLSISTYDSVATVSALPATGNQVDDIYVVLQNLNPYTWDGDSWEPLTGESGDAYTADGIIDLRYWDGDSWETLGTRLYAVWVKKPASIPVEDPTDISARAQAAENKAVNIGLTKNPYPYVTGLELKADIMLGDLTLNTIDEDGVVWVCTDIEGWWSHPDPEFQDLSRGLGDGSYDVRGRYAARQIVLKGVFLTPDASYVQAARDKLVQATDLVYRGDYLKVNEGPMKYAFVRLSGKPEIQTVNARGRTEFSIGLRAADPVKYEWIDAGPDFYNEVDIPAKNVSLSRTGTVTVTNTGNTKVPVIIEITGEVTATAANPAKIKNITRDETIEVVDITTGDDVLTIDTYNREVIYNDTTLGSRARVGILAQWIYLDPGANQINFEDTSNANSTAVCRILFQSGWIA